MARARNIKPGFFKNEVLAEMPMEARMLFIGLWTLADREGRLEDRPKRIKMELFPYDSFDVDPMLSRLQADGFLTRYDVGGVRFIQIENFVKHQDPHYKEKASEIPPPEGVEDIIKATAVTRGQRVRILERDGYRCQSCGAESHLCIDHVIPVSRGGDSSDDNLQVLCHSCNTKKGNKLDGEEKGQKKSIHRPGAVIARPNVGSNSNQQKCTSPSDSLSSDSLIPDSLNPDSLIEAKASSSSAKPDALPPCPHAELIDLFGQHLPMLPQPKVEAWSGARAKALQTRWRWVLTAKKRDGTRYATNRNEALAWFSRYFNFVARSDFLSGRDGKWTGCDLGWLANETNFAKVIQGNYDNRELEAA